jgi:acyl carrier protein
MLVFVLVLGSIIFFHELGHFLAAKFFGVYCGEFSLGMGPSVFHIQKGETEMEFEKLKEIIIDVLNVSDEDIKMESTFVDDLGADSLDIFQIIMGIEEAFDIEIENEDAEKIVTVGDAVEQIKNAVN